MPNKKAVVPNPAKPTKGAGNAKAVQEKAKPVTGTAKVKRPTMRGWKIIPTADVVESDVVLARYP